MGNALKSLDTLARFVHLLFICKGILANIRLLDVFFLILKVVLL